MAVYIVFDVETPNRANDRMSAIGITAIKDSKIAANYFSLVDPETHFDYFNMQLTGIDSEKVKGAPNFAELWKRIEPIMSKGISQPTMDCEDARFLDSDGMPLTFKTRLSPFSERSFRSMMMTVLRDFTLKTD